MIIKLSNKLLTSPDSLPGKSWVSNFKAYQDQCIEHPCEFIYKNYTSYPAQ